MDIVKAHVSLAAAVQDYAIECFQSGIAKYQQPVTEPERYLQQLVERS